MSALIGIRAPDRVHLLTDATSIFSHNGAVAAIWRKQAFLRNGTAIASIGKWPRAERFAQMADDWLKDFDAVINATLDLWAEAGSTMSAVDQATRSVMVLAGWSVKAGRLAMYLLDENGKLAEAAAYAAGPINTCAEVLDDFLQRFGRDPASFTSRDGVAFMEKLRREHLRRYENAMRPVVGGYVTHSVVMRDGTETEVVHQWPDKIGQPIELDDTVDPEKAAHVTATA
jgi:hypothetical protein